MKTVLKIMNVKEEEVREIFLELRPSIGISQPGAITLYAKEPKVNRVQAILTIGTDLGITVHRRPENARKDFLTTLDGFPAVIQDTF